jgi:hypothetical protein
VKALTGTFSEAPEHNFESGYEQLLVENPDLHIEVAARNNIMKSTPPAAQILALH